jgi:LacI family transcriptional regulator
MSDISMRDLAEILGVSVASVSVALRGRSGISEETRARILAEAQSRGYDMSRLNTSSMKGFVEIIDYSYAKIGLTMDHSTYYSQLIEAISSRLSDEGYEMSGPYSPNETSFSTRPKAAGSILIGSMISENELRQFSEAKVPFVVDGNPMTRTPVNSVSHDNIGGISSAVEHLVSYGHTRIGYIICLMAPLGLKGTAHMSTRFQTKGCRRRACGISRISIHYRIFRSCRS